jgi:hypothetical protein
MKFPTHAVLSTSTSRLLGDIGGVYAVLSFLIGRSAYTHEIAYYGRRAAAALKQALPDLPTKADAREVNEENYRDFLYAWEAKFGAEIDLPDSLRDCLADEKSGLGTAEEMKPGKVIVIKRGESND